MFAIENKYPLNQIDLKLSPSERIQNFIKTIDNPYIVIEDGNKTKISFTGKGSLKQTLEKYFIDKHAPDEYQPLQGGGINLA